MASTHFTLAVVGGGSGGVGAALAAARRGVKTVVIERGPWLGGTSTLGGVNCWEMGVGGTGIPFDIYRQLKARVPAAVGIYSLGRHFSFQDAWYWPHRLDKVNFPGGELVLDPARRYCDSLRRHPGDRPADEAWQRAHWHGVPFLPEAMARTMHDAIVSTGHAAIRYGCQCTAADVDGDRVVAVRLSDKSRITADYFVDATGGSFAHAVGCQSHCGIDPRSRFGEPSAPDAGTNALNGVSLIYRISPTTDAAIEALPPATPADCWWATHFPPMSCFQYPNLDRNCNMLPTMEGNECVRLGYQAAFDECTRRVHSHWHFVQTHFPEFRRYRLTWIAPMLGIREGRRVICRKMLTENDIAAGLSRQHEPDIITIADHALDRHGQAGGCPELREPYGVPYRCLLPMGFVNLAIVSRAAGFSSIAASSCRLSRTMMQLGQAAGNAVALALELGCPLPDVPADQLRARLRAEHVQLAWPTPPELAAYLAREDAR